MASFFYEKVGYGVCFDIKEKTSTKFIDLK
jgi:hypothetical protein